MHPTTEDLVMFQHGQLTRRQLVGGAIATLASAGLATKARSDDVQAATTIGGRKPELPQAATAAKTTEMVGYGEAVLPPGIRSRFVHDINGLTMHVLEAGFDGQDRPCVLLLHGFPELAYSWRKVMLPLAALARPRKHYQWYYSTREADGNMRNCPQGIHAFLRAYYHYKSADWKQNKPFPLKSWTAEELAKLPTYYIMDRDQGMAETVAPMMPSAAEIAACQWLPDDELRVYSEEFRRTGFQGGLQWYRCATSGKFNEELEIFSGRTIDVPSCFIAGKCDWGIYQRPGSLERMQTAACTRMSGCHLVDGAGHWVQQEQPEEVSKLLIRSFQQQTPPS